MIEHGASLSVGSPCGLCFTGNPHRCCLTGTFPEVSGLWNLVQGMSHGLDVHHPFSQPARVGLETLHRVGLEAGVEMEHGQQRRSTAGRGGSHWTPPRQKQVQDAAPGVVPSPGCQDGDAGPLLTEGGVSSINTLVPGMALSSCSRQFCQHHLQT